MGAIDERVGGGGASEEQVGFDPLTFAVDVRVDAVSPFGVGPRRGDVDVVRGGADPDFATLPGGGLLPDADVMPLGEGVERFLKDEIWRLAIDREERDGGLLVTGAADGRADCF